MAPDLVVLADDLASRLSRPAVALYEFCGPYGVPDLTMVALDEARLEARLASNVAPLLNEMDAAIISVLNSGRGLRPSALARRLSWPLESFERRLPGLVRAGAITKTSTGTYVRHPAMVSVGTLYAFEAKIRDWTRALQQARRYALWTDYVTVTLRHSGEWMDEARSTAGARGVGLAIGDQWAVRPRRRRIPAGRRLWASEHVIAALDAADQETPARQPAH